MENTTAGNKLYRALEPYNRGRLRVSALHEIYYEEAGNPDGVPVLTVHGGPGGGASPTLRRFHDPNVYRIICFDQRGCGRSTPHAELRENTTWDLVNDMELLRTHLDIDDWHLFGGSWGATLSLTYAQTHPLRVRSLVLRGIFLLRQREIDWFYRDGCNWIYPDAYEKLVQQLHPHERHDVVSAFHRRLIDPDIEVQLAAARAWGLWEGSTLSVNANPDKLHQFGSDRYVLAFARIECHYFFNRGFFEYDDLLLRQIDRIRHIPATIVNGRLDMITPVRNAWELAKAWPEAELRIVPQAGHAMTEAGTVHELISATRKMSDL